MRVLISEKLADKGVELLREAGHTVDVKLDLTPEQLVEQIGDYEALIVRSATQATREVIEAGTNLRIIGRAGVGVDNVDVTAATERGVIVCNAPTSNVVSAAEQTLALILASARKTPQANASMKQGKWDRGKFSGRELYQKTLAIFGLGRIGGLVADRARAFDMKIIGFDPYCSPERAAQLGVTLYEDIDEILPQADFITVHLPKTKETIGMFSTEQYAKMKDGVFLVNTARGGIYDVEAMGEFLENGKIGGAAIDVYAKEPCTDSPLIPYDNVILTPHLGASTKEAQARAGEQIAEFVLLGLEGKMVPTAVNVALIAEDVMSAVAPYIDAATTCGSILVQLADEAISSLHITVVGDLANNDVSVLGTACLRGIFAASLDDPVNLVNAAYIAEQRGVSVSIDTQPNHDVYASRVQFVARAGSKDIEVSVTISGDAGAPRVVSVLGYKLDLIPGHEFIVFKYPDRPGQIGKIGTVLGDANINISTMEVGTSESETGVALILLNVDQEVPDSVRTELIEKAGVLEAFYISL